MKHWSLRIGLVFVVVGLVVLAGSCNPFDPLAAAGFGDLKIYWVENSQIFSVNLDGSGPISTVISETGKTIGAIYLDKINDYIYWTITSAPPGLYRADLDGSNKTTILNSMDGTDLIVDPSNEMLYYCNSTGIYQVDLTTNSETQMYAAATITDIAIDHVNDKIYWTDGSSVWNDTISTGLTAGTAILTGSFYAIAVDPIGERFYWADHSGGNSIMSANLNGTSPELVYGGDLALSIAIDPQEGNIYWTIYGAVGYVYRSKIGSLTSVEVVKDRPNSPIDLFVDIWP
jgi:hypothetical protein